MNTIELENGKTVQIDESDYSMLASFKWYSAAKGYCAANVGGSPMLMHRLIMGAKSNEQVDHINHDKLDNRRCNLRLATRSQNAMNMNKSKIPKSSRFKGVSWCKSNKKWRAELMVDRKRIWLQYFENEVEAAFAYDEKARTVFNEFSFVNLPNMRQDCGLLVVL